MVAFVKKITESRKDRQLCIEAIYTGTRAGAICAAAQKK
jgi:hypothetical protein